MLTPADIDFPWLGEQRLKTFAREFLENNWEVVHWPCIVDLVADHLTKHHAEKGGELRVLWQGVGTYRSAMALKELCQRFGKGVVSWWSGPQLQGFSLPSQVSMLESAAVSGEWDCLIWANAQPLPIGYEGCCYRPPLDPAYAACWQARFQGEQKAFLATIGQTIQADAQPVLFVAIARGSTPSMEYVVEQMAKRPNVVTFALTLIDEPATGLYQGNLFCHRSLALLAETLRALPAMPVYLQAHARWSFLGQLIKAINPHLRIYQEIYDWMEAFVGDPQVFIEEKIFSPGDLALMFHTEQFILHEIAGIFYKDGGPWIEEKLRAATVTTRRILPCPPQSWFQPIDLARPLVTPPRLVFAGQIRAEKSMAKRVFGDMDLLGMSQEITAQGIPVTFYNNINHSRIHRQSEYGVYLQEAEKNPLFQFRQGIPIGELIRALAGNFDYGMILFNGEEKLAVGDNHVRGCVASKLYTYLAAGLPILVCEEFAQMAEIVTNDRLGIAVKREDFPRLGQILATLDYSALLAHVVKARERYHMDRFVADICQLMLGKE